MLCVVSAVAADPELCVTCPFCLSPSALTAAAVQCPELSQYSVCASSCPATCSDLTAPLACTSPCSESCECPEGHVLSADRCVPVQGCGCDVNGRYYPVGESFWASPDCTVQCHCEPGGEARCFNTTCPEGEICTIENGYRGCYPKRETVCLVGQDQVLQTFDGITFPYPLEQSYTLLKTCPERADFIEVDINQKKVGSAPNGPRVVRVQAAGQEVKIGGARLADIKVKALPRGVMACGVIQWRRAYGSVVVDTQGHLNQHEEALWVPVKLLPQHCSFCLLGRLSCLPLLLQLGFSLEEKLLFCGAKPKGSAVCPHFEEALGPGGWVWVRECLMCTACFGKATSPSLKPLHLSPGR